ARDPAWNLTADLAAALLWWHPAVWWTRSQLHFANETAADEASLLVPDGPGVLAECLVGHGGRLIRQTAAWRGGVGGTGWRSGLAGRVERLSGLRDSVWRPPRPRVVTWTRNIFLGMSLLGIFMLLSWVIPVEPSNKGEDMNTWKTPLSILFLT